MKISVHFKKLLCMIIAFVFAYAKAQDSTALLKEYNRVMSFKVRPYVYYTTLTKKEADPVLQPGDTATVTTEFYKSGRSIYAVNKDEMTFIEDSLFIHVRHEEKSIWISKMNANARVKMHVLPLEEKQSELEFWKNFVISKNGSGRQGRLDFVSRRSGRPTQILVNSTVLYSKEKFLPEIVESAVTGKLKVNNKQIKEFEKKGINITNAVVTIDSVKYLLYTRKSVMHFIDIDLTPAKAMQLPSWKSVLDFNKATGTFTGKGNYSNYTITKKF